MDIFISYRRTYGESWAMLLKEKLRAKGVKVFLDKHSMNNGDFSEIIKRNIRNSPNFLLVLSKDIFEFHREDDVDWVREEIIYATRQKKNLIAVVVNGYDMNCDLSGEPPEIARLQTWDMITYNDINEKMEQACLNTIIERMKDEDGNPFSLIKQPKSNNWYELHEVTEDDNLWMSTNVKVCNGMDWAVFERILKEGTLQGRREINLFCLDLYDVPAYKKRYELSPKRQSDAKIDGVYGFCHSYNLEEANSAFGEDHFIMLCDEGDYCAAAKSILKKNGLRGFDIIDLTLILKDTVAPQEVLRGMVKCLHPDGGVIFVRDLDDDYVDAHPDENGYIRKLVELLTLDTGAGNRHYGKTIYTQLKKAGADKVYISDELVSTANHKSEFNRTICDGYFSYLIPEFKALAADHPDESEYCDALDWLNKNYPVVESMFSSTEFYFRAGFISGYGVFNFEDEDE